MLGLVSDQAIGYQFVGELVEPAVLAAAIHGHFGEALADDTQSSPAITAAREFLDAHQRRAGR